MAFFGTPATRTEEETCFVTTSYDFDLGHPNRDHIETAFQSDFLLLLVDLMVSKNLVGELHDEVLHSDNSLTRSNEIQ
jgi:hypothetical protein